MLLLGWMVLALGVGGVDGLRAELRDGWWVWGGLKCIAQFSGFFGLDCRVWFVV